MQNAIVSPFLFDVRFCLTTLPRSRLIEAALRKRGASVKQITVYLTPRVPDQRRKRTGHFRGSIPRRLRGDVQSFLFDADFLYPEPIHRQSTLLAGAFRRPSSRYNRRARAVARRAARFRMAHRVSPPRRPPARRTSRKACCAVPVSLKARAAPAWRFGQARGIAFEVKYRFAAGP
mgnify:CR=1 FL=1